MGKPPLEPCLIALGSNLGDRAAILTRAVDRLSATPGITVLRVSRIYETAPSGGPPGQGPFLNAAAMLQTSLEPLALLAVLHNIEAELGRVRDVHWGARTLDLDLLLDGGRVINSPALTVPHPRMQTRRFVLEPAAEIAADMLHPVLRRTIGELLAELPADALTNPNKDD